MEKDSVQQHYERVWGRSGRPRYFYKGPIQKLNPDFCILEFEPTPDREMWTYATCCMSHTDYDDQLELHLFSYERDESLIELLTVVASFHYQGGNKLGLHHTVNFGRPWREGSACDHGYISLSYLDGPDLQNAEIEGHPVQFYWLIPVTKQEVEFKTVNGIDRLEDRFEETGFNYLDPYRESVV